MEMIEFHSTQTYMEIDSYPYYKLIDYKVMLSLSIFFYYVLVMVHEFETHVEVFEHFEENLTYSIH